MKANEVFNTLANGNNVHLNGFFITTDEHGLWVTNPYGNDSFMGELTLQKVGALLERVNRPELPDAINYFC